MLKNSPVFDELLFFYDGSVVAKFVACHVGYIRTEAVSKCFRMTLSHLRVLGVEISAVVWKGPSSEGHIDIGRERAWRNSICIGSHASSHPSFGDCWGRKRLSFSACLSPASFSSLLPVVTLAAAVLLYPLCFCQYPWFLPDCFPCLLDIQSILVSGYLFPTASMRDLVAVCAKGVLHVTSIAGLLGADQLVPFPFELLVVSSWVAASWEGSSSCMEDDSLGAFDLSVFPHTGNREVAAVEV